MSCESSLSRNSFYSARSEILRKPSLSEAISNTIDLAVGRVKSVCLGSRGSPPSWPSKPHNFVSRNTGPSVSITYDDIISRLLMQNFNNHQSNERKRKSEETGTFPIYDIGSRTLSTQKTDVKPASEQPSTKKPAYAPQSKSRTQSPIRHNSRNRRRNRTPIGIGLGDFPIYDFSSRTLVHNKSHSPEVAPDNQNPPETKVAASIEEPLEIKVNHFFPRSSKITNITDKKSPNHGSKPNAKGTGVISARKPKVEHKANYKTDEAKSQAALNKENSAFEVTSRAPMRSSVRLRKALPVMSQPVDLKLTDELTSIPDKPSRMGLTDSTTRVKHSTHLLRGQPAPRVSRKLVVGSNTRGGVNTLATPTRVAVDVEVIYVSPRSMHSNDSLGFGETAEEITQDSKGESLESEDVKEAGDHEMIEVLRQWRNKSTDEGISQSSILEQASRYFNGNHFSKNDLQDFLLTSRVEQMDRLKVAVKDLQVIEKFLDTITSNEELDYDQLKEVFYTSVERLNSSANDVKLTPESTHICRS